MLKDNLKSIPKSTAKTAWGLLQDVKRAITNDYRRIDMLTFGRYTRSEDSNSPACGTVGCFAGWVVMIHDGVTRPQPIVTHRAQAILGKDLNYQTVGNGREHVFNAGNGDECQDQQPGTPDMARAVVKRISRFMKVNAKALRSKRVR